MSISPMLVMDALKDRKRYASNKEAQLARWRADIATMEMHAGDGNLTYRDKLTELKHEMQTAEDQLERIQGATEDAWDGLRTRLDKAWEELSDSFETIKQELEETLN
jgi:uncharacterized protein YukE